jgi:hypothetical protein
MSQEQGKLKHVVWVAFAFVVVIVVCVDAFSYGPRNTAMRLVFAFASLCCIGTVVHGDSGDCLTRVSQLEQRATYLRKRLDDVEKALRGMHKIVEYLVKESRFRNIDIDQLRRELNQALTQSYQSRYRLMRALRRACNNSQGNCSWNSLAEKCDCH